MRTRTTVAIDGAPLQVEWAAASVPQARHKPCAVTNFDNPGVARQPSRYGEHQHHAGRLPGEGEPLQLI